MHGTRWAFATFGGVVLVLAAGACTTEESSPSPDGGSAGASANESGSSGSSGHGGTSGTGAADASMDAYVWIPRDSGSAGSSGSGSSGSGGSGGGEGDSSIAGRMCAMAREPLPEAILPRCTSATRDCIAGCMAAEDGDACRDACISADTTPAETSLGLNCGACIYLSLFACIDATDCHDAVAELFCCIADNCPTGSPDGCTELECPAELQAAITCGYYADMSCVDLLGPKIAGCFEGGGEDGGL